MEDHFNELELLYSKMEVLYRRKLISTEQFIRYSLNILEELDYFLLTDEQLKIIQEVLNDSYNILLLEISMNNLLRTANN